jgi:hypothetical protein
LDFLSDDLLGAAHNPLDAGTLAAAAAADPPGEAKRKRAKREEVEAGSNGEEDLSDDDEDEPRGKSGKRKGSAAAQNKANREKARREKINDRYVLAAVARASRMAAWSAQQQACLWTPGHAGQVAPLAWLLIHSCYYFSPRRFTELAKLVDPSNEPKTDKLSVLGEAIRFVQQTQVENSQLRQLNKFLEVRSMETGRCIQGSTKFALV